MIILAIIFYFCFLTLSYAQPFYPSNKDIDEYIADYKNTIDANNWKDLLNDSQIKYLKSIINFFELKEPTSNYPRTLEKIKTFDRGDLLLGLYTDNEGKNWVISNRVNYAGYEQYKNFVSKIMIKIADARLTYLNSNMQSVGKEYMVKYNLLVMAGLSRGWQAYPNAKLQHKRMTTEENLKYAFKVNQQALRHALLQHYVNELYELRKETMGFINFVKDLCHSSSSIFQRTDKIDDIPSVSASPDIIISKRCSGTLTYNRILQGMKNLAEFLFEMNQRELTVLCTQASLLAWQSNMLMTMNELRLSKLSALFNFLQNFE